MAQILNWLFQLCMAVLSVCLALAAVFLVFKLCPSWLKGESQLEDYDRHW